MMSWRKNICVLLENPLQIVPDATAMSPDEYEATLARLLFVVTGFLYWYFPSTKYWAYAAFGIVMMYLNSANKPGVVGTEHFLNEDDFKAKLVEQTKAALIADANQAKPVVAIPVLTNDMKVRAEAIGQEYADKRSAARATMVQNQLYDRKKLAEQMLVNIREQEYPRGAILPSEDEQIFSTRQSVRDTNDGYRTMFNEIPNSSMKYLVRDA
jgi:hypothetical protein